MVRPRHLLLALALSIAPAAGVAGESWEKLKPGMSPVQTASVLGDNLFSSRGRDFEIGIYDGKAEVVFLRGKLVAWTSPAAKPSVPSPTNLFQFEQRIVPSLVPPRAPVQRIEAPRRGSILPSYRL